MVTFRVLMALPILFFFSVVSIHCPRDRNTAKVVAKHAQIQSFRAALEGFHRDTGRYPSETEGLAALRHRLQIKNWKGPYLAAEVPTDPWNKPYIYRPQPGGPPAIE